MARLVELIGRSAEGEGLEAPPAVVEDPSEGRVCRVTDPIVQRTVRVYDDSVHGISRLLRLIRAGWHDWDLSVCEEIVSRLWGALVEDQRFLLFACSRRFFEGSELPREMLAHHAVVSCVGMLGVAMTAGKPRERVWLAGLAGLVQNLGMSLIPQEIIEKKGALTRDEFERVRRHPVLCAEMPQIAQREELAAIVAQSHERVDGSGYPEGLTRDDIHPLALLLHPVDVLTAVTRPRPYRSAENSYNALKILNMARQNQLDSHAVREIIEFFTIYPIGSYVELNTSQRGKVIDTDARDVLRPLLAVLVDSAGEPLFEPFPLDLERRPSIYVTGVVSDLALEALGAEYC